MFSERSFLSTPNGVQTAHTEWLPGVWLRHSVSSVHWRLKPEVFWVQLPATASFFTFLYFHLITSKFIYFQREARCSEQIRNVILVCLITFLSSGGSCTIEVTRSPRLKSCDWSHETAQVEVVRLKSQDCPGESLIHETPQVQVTWLQREKILDRPGGNHATTVREVGRRPRLKSHDGKKKRP